MTTTILVPAFLLLAAPFIGSFLGVVAMRYGDGRPMVLGRSECDGCHETLRWGELIPVASWLVLRRRCRHCGARLSGFYPLVEIAALAPVLWAMAVVPAPLLTASVVLGWTLLALALVDGRSFRLPDALTAFLLAAGIIAAYFFDRDRWFAHLIGAAAGFAVFALVALLYRLLRGRDGLGLGDAKLLAGLGAWVAWEGLPTVIFLSAVIGLLFALGRAVWRRSFALHERLPFGPFLALGGWIVWLYGPLILA